LIVGVDEAAGLGSLRYTGADGDWYSRGDRDSDAEVTYVYFGNGHEFPRDSEITMPEIEQALAELLDNVGKRPTCVAWQPDR
jgi:hypothetical protein